jgi:hypothetical protein
MTAIILSPLTLKLLLHTFDPPPFLKDSEDPEIARGLQELQKLGLIDPVEIPKPAEFIETAGVVTKVDQGVYRTYRATEKGQAHIHQLCQIPLPEQKWVDHQGQAIVPVT